MTPEQAKLTIVDLVGLIGGYDSVEAYLQHISTSTRGYTTTERLLARALLASQTALRSGCRGCKEGWPFASEARHVIPKGVLSMWAACLLNDEQMAALLNQGDGDE